LRVEIVPGYGTKERKLPDMGLPAEIIDLLRGKKVPRIYELIIASTGGRGAFVKKEACGQ
jgi:hypothetical protein